MVCEDNNDLSEMVPNVLILVLMEYGLRARWQADFLSSLGGVLILVLMEYGLRGILALMVGEELPLS